MIENGIDFEYYSDFTPSQARLIEAIDQERLALCRAYGVKVRDVAQTFHDEYGYEGTLYEMIKHADVYKGIKGPSALNGRFLTEDIPYPARHTNPCSNRQHSHAGNRHRREPCLHSSGR